MRRISPLEVAALLLLASAHGCRSVGTEAHSLSRASDAAPFAEGQLLARIQVTAAATSTVSSVTLESSATSGSTALALDGAVYSGLLTVPTGSQTFTAKAFDGSRLIGAATSTLDIAEGATADLFLDIVETELADGGTADGGMADGGMADGGMADGGMADGGMADRPPMIVSFTVSKTSVQVGEVVALSVAAVDPDGDPLTYQWSQLCSAGAAATFSATTAADTMWTATSAGSCTVEIAVTAKTLAANNSATISISGAAPPPLAAGRVAFAALPAHGGTVVNPWSNGEPRIVNDNKGSELIGFGFSDKLYGFKSGDLGSTWSFVDPLSSESIGTRDILCAAQDSMGKIHLLFKNGPSGLVQYARLALSRSGGLISGFSSEIKDVPLPGVYNTNLDVRATLQMVFDASGAETLVYQVSDNAPGSTFHLQMGKATSLTPNATADFVKLDGSSGNTAVFATSTFNNHDHSAFFAQMGTTRDLWAFWGPTDAEYGAQDSTFTTRLRLSTAGMHAWSVGAPITMVGSDAISSPEVLSVYGTQQFVWLMYLDPTSGLSFDRVDATGNLTHSAIPSPDPAAHRNGWGVFSVSADETRIWAIWNTISRSGPGVDDRTQQAFWNGSTWTTYADPLSGDSWGMGGSLGWSEGVVATRLDGNSYGISLSTVRGGAKAP